MRGMSGDSAWATHYKDVCQRESTSPAPEIFFRLYTNGLPFRRDFPKIFVNVSTRKFTGQMQHSVIYDVVCFITGRIGTEQAKFDLFLFRPLTGRKLINWHEHGNITVNRK